MMHETFCRAILSLCFYFFVMTHAAMVECTQYMNKCIALLNVAPFFPELKLM